MFEMLEMINNRSDNSLKTKFNEEEKKFWIEKERQQLINFAIWFNNSNNTYKSYEEIVDKYYDSTFSDSNEAGI